jgi:hypothetical protein
VKQLRGFDFQPCFAGLAHLCPAALDASLAEAAAADGCDRWYLVAW